MKEWWGRKMNIRLYTENDLDRMIEIWFDGSKLAHNFIQEDYWKSNQTAMKETYLPMSRSHVLEVDGIMVGFISLIDDYLAALFVSPHEQGKGYGKILLDYVKDQKESMSLQVYQENERAIRFYEKNGFIVSDESIDEKTSAKEFVMTWRKPR
ncbi:N-acetyltransferase [Paenibacillus puerhi]|uniref:N-acetyltransferase n=1 Tax=Paenibacillus puerhi TaxID=2692622 RepID=UPI001F19BC2E|nr:N-acetyltransferase [Paenibacillus puerhi]